MFVVLEELVDLIRKFVALFKALVVRAYQHDSQVDLFEADIDMKHVFFSATWHTDGSPSLTISHRAQCHHKIEDHGHIYKNSYITYSLAINHKDN